MDRLFAVATGWLGWAPDIAWRTPLPELFIAMDAKIEWARMTNPFGNGRSAEKPKPTTVAEKLRQALTGQRSS